MCFNAESSVENLMTVAFLVAVVLMLIAVFIFFMKVVCFLVAVAIGLAFLLDVWLCCERVCI